MKQYWNVQLTGIPTLARFGPTTPKHTRTLPDRFSIAARICPASPIVQEDAPDGPHHPARQALSDAASKTAVDSGLAPQTAKADESGALCSTSSNCRRPPALPFSTRAARRNGSHRGRYASYVGPGQGARSGFFRPPERRVRWHARPGLRRGQRDARLSARVLAIDQSAASPAFSLPAWSAPLPRTWSRDRPHYRTFHTCVLRARSIADLAREPGLCCEAPLPDSLSAPERDGI